MMHFEDSEPFGTRYFFKTDGVQNSRVLVINRNFAIGSYPEDTDRYHIKLTSSDGQYLGGIALGDDDMLELFRAYISMREEYDKGEEDRGTDQ